MTKEEFSELLCHPDRTGSFAEELAALVEAHPCFHSAHLLLLRSLKQNGDEPGFADQTGRSALCVRNRTILYNYIYHPEEFCRQTGMGTNPASGVRQPSPKTAGTPEKTTNLNDPLIEEFLNKNPKIIPSDTAYQADIHAGLTEDENFASEILADIYVHQRHIRKAVKIYEQLILKYPEKHAYFASQIDRLKKEL
ncbi:MAG: hypothetical protein LBR08_07620 [Bacteroidales bacterium]|jgi:hypothetical protein|nr:hypothetical protein [Bacteroidales bacterium]